MKLSFVLSNSGSWIYRIDIVSVITFGIRTTHTKLYGGMEEGLG